MTAPARILQEYRFPLHLEPAVQSIWELYSRAKERRWDPSRSLDWAAVEAWTPADGALWLHLDYSAPDAARWLQQTSGIDPVVLEALLDTDPRPRALPQPDDSLLLIVRGITHNTGSELDDMISIRIWIEPQRIVTLRHRHSRSLDSLAADLRLKLGRRP